VTERALAVHRDLHRVARCGRDRVEMAQVVGIFLRDTERCDLAAYAVGDLGRVVVRAGSLWRLRFRLASCRSRAAMRLRIAARVSGEL
jgi:hypothetical protein